MLVFFLLFFLKSRSVLSNGNGQSKSISILIIAGCDPEVTIATKFVTEKHQVGVVLCLM